MTIRWKPKTLTALNDQRNAIAHRRGANPAREARRQAELLRMAHRERICFLPGAH